MKRHKVVVAVLACVAALSVPSMAAAQSYGDVLPLVSEIATGTADENGQFTYRYTAPDEIDGNYLVYVVGTDDDGDPFEWVVAQVTPAFAGLSWTLAGADMEPGSDFVLETRAADPDAADADADTAANEESDDAAADADADDEAAGDADDDDAADDDADDEVAAAADDDDGNSARGLIGIALLLAIIAAALIYGVRLTNRRRA